MTVIEANIEHWNVAAIIIASTVNLVIFLVWLGGRWALGTTVIP